MAKPKDITTINTWDAEWPSIGYKDLLPDDVEVQAWNIVGSYQGDYVILVKHTASRQWGFLTIGYGSCSGCDILEGYCSNDNIEERRVNLQELADSICFRIHWERTAEEMASFIKKLDPANQWWMNDDGCEEAINDCLAVLKTKTSNLIDNTAW